MNVDDLLGLVHASGIILSARGDRLHVDAPVGALTPDLRDALVRYKPELLARLTPVTDFVHLPGLVLPRQALDLALDLEALGVRLGLDLANQITVEPTPTSGPLTPADRGRYCPVASAPGRACQLHPTSDHAEDGMSDNTTNNSSSLHPRRGGRGGD